MTYKLVECKRCGRLSIHKGEKVFICPYCHHEYKLNGGTIIFQSDDYREVLNKRIALEESAGKKAHFEIYKE